MNKRSVGSDTEELACEFLRSQGALIIEKNYRCKNGEIDIIARDGKYICFIEVKFRKSTKFGEPEEAVSCNKQKRICKVSKFYLYSKYQSLDTSIRYDVVAISPKEKILTFKWIKNAFDYR